MLKALISMMVGFAVLGLVFARAQHSQLTSPAWHPNFYNPKPAEADLVLPMPCGGAMVFRPVITPAGPGALDDRLIIMGQVDPEVNYSEFVRQDALVGGFGESESRYYYLAKYELTRDQAATLTDGPCPAPSNEGRLPKSGIGWFEANNLAFKYNQWLYQNAREKLPKAGRAHGFVRLPTEAEWEYAARGGTAVSESEYRNQLFPMKEDVNRYAWSQGTQSAAGRLHPIGMLLPNPLGFYDIIGNVSEIVFEPYRINRVGRLHGRSGGFIVKGGDFQTASGRLRSSMRLEIRHFDPHTGAVTRLQTVGVRFAIAATIVEDLTKVRVLQAEFDELGKRKDALPDDPQQLISDMITDIVEPGLRRRLQLISGKLAEQTRARKEFEARAVQSSIRSGALLVRDIRDMDARIKAIGGFIDVAKTDADKGVVDSERRVQEYSEAAGRVKERQRISLDTYARLVVGLGNDYANDFDFVQQQLAITSKEFLTGSLQALSDFSKLFVRHAEAYRQTKDMASEVWLREIIR